MEARRAEQRAPDEWNRVRKPLNPTKANDQKVDSLQWFKQFVSKLDKTPALVLA